MRRHDRKITEAEAYALLQKGEYGILSMCTTQGEVYGVPLNYALHQNCVYFHCATQGSKLDNLRQHNKVSFCVVGRTELLPSMFATIYESVIVSGIATEVDGDEKRQALLYLVEKYSPDYISEGKEYIEKAFSSVVIIKLTIESVSGKARK